jgi:hypothetical protein
MTLQQKLLWERLTKEVREAGMDNLRARELYEEISKLIDMSDKVLLSITEKDQGLEVRLGEQAYGNLAVVGLLEKIKLTILESEPSGEEILASKKYDA